MADGVVLVLPLALGVTVGDGVAVLEGQGEAVLEPEGEVEVEAEDELEGMRRLKVWTWL